MKLPNFVNSSIDSSIKIGHDFVNKVVQKVKLWKKYFYTTKSLSKSDFLTTSQCSGWLYKIKWFHLNSFDFCPKTLRFRTQPACYTKSKYSITYRCLYIKKSESKKWKFSSIWETVIKSGLYDSLEHQIIKRSKCCW